MANRILSGVMDKGDGTPLLGFVDGAELHPCDCLPAPAPVSCSVASPRAASVEPRQRRSFFGIAAQGAMRVKQSAAFAAAAIAATARKACGTLAPLAAQGYDCIRPAPFVVALGLAAVVLPALSYGARYISASNAETGIRMTSFDGDAAPFIAAPSGPNAVGVKIAETKAPAAKPKADQIAVFINSIPPDLTSNDAIAEMIKGSRFDSPDIVFKGKSPKRYRPTAHPL